MGKRAALNTFKNHLLQLLVSKTEKSAVRLQRRSKVFLALTQFRKTPIIKQVFNC